MKSVGFPLNKKRKQAAEVVAQSESPPLEKFAVWTLARTGGGSVKRQICRAKMLRKLVEIAGMSGPGDELRRGESAQAKAVRTVRLLWVGRDDFEIASFAEGQKRVASAATGMNSAKCGTDTRSVLHERNAFIEIAAAEENVIEKGGHVGGSPENTWRGEGTAGKREK